MLSRCSALGVLVDLSVSCSGKALICNTETRCAELCEDIARVFSDGKLGSKQAQRLRGRMQFAEAQFFRRTGKRCLRVLTDFAESKRTMLTCKDKFCLRMFQDLPDANILREVAALGQANVAVFTDAC